MYRNKLIEEILKFPEETEFFILGQGLNEGFPQKDFNLITFKEYYEGNFLDEEDMEEYCMRHNENLKDVILKQ
jgi:hypothetical protein